MGLSIAALNDKQDRIEQELRRAENDVSNALDEVEYFAKKITSAETDRTYGKQFAAAKKKWNAAKKRKAMWQKRSNANISAIHRAAKVKLPKLGNPTRQANPLKKFNVVSSSGKRFQIIAASEAAARRQVAAMFKGARIVNPMERGSRGGGWIPAHAVRIRRNKLEILR